MRLFGKVGARMTCRPDIPVLYEDNHILVVQKPVNLPVQEDLSGDPDLLTLLKAYIKEKYAKPGEVYLGLVHRLDRPVGGVMVFARTSKAAARLTSQFASHQARKRYAAVVTGSPEPEAQLTDWLFKDPSTFSSRVVPPGTPDAKEARLRYACIGRSGQTALLDVELFTGRPHQIRVQLSHAGLPIEGDQRYNPSAAPGTQIALWSYALTFQHPTLKEEMTFTCPPEGAAFSRFPAQVRLLPAFRVCRGIYLDDSMLAVDKNPGCETEGDLLAELESLFPSVLPVHRLDANTSGVLLFALTEACQEDLLARFSSHSLEKVYHAVVRGTPKAEFALTDYLVKDASSATVSVSTSSDPDARLCRLSGRLLRSAGDRSLVEIRLITGRTHQIRVQMAHAGFPVLGDDKYGDRSFNRAHKCTVQQLLCKRISWDGRTLESCRELTLF